MIEVRSIVRPGGLLSDWLDFTEPFEFPDSYSLYSFLGAASAAVNGRIIVNPNTEPCVKTNLYVLLFGPPGARKGPPMRFAVEALAEACPDTPRLPRSFTMEAITTEMAERSEEEGRCGGLIFTEEFHRLIGGKDYQLDNLGFLSELWDCPEDYPRRTVARGVEMLLRPYTVIVAASNPDWIETVDPRVLSGGALRRLLTVNEYGPKCDDRTSPVKDKAKYDKVVKLMTQRLGPRAFRDRTAMILTPAAQAAMDEWYVGPVRELRRTADIRLGYFASCVQAHALKLAAVVNLLEGGMPHLLDEQSMREGMKLVEALIPGTAQLYSSLVPTPYARMRAGIQRIVGGSGERGLTVKEIIRAVVASHGVKPREVQEALTAMVREEHLKLLPDGKLIGG
jgi:hypothetical protein